MNELQTSLIAIGGTILVGVISYNKWQEYKAKKSVERAFSSEHDDVLMTPGATAAPPMTERHEPTLARESVTLATATDVNDPDSIHVSAHDPEPADFVQAPRSHELAVDDLIDCAIPLALAGPVRSDKIILPLQSLRHVGNKPVHFIGERDDGVWESITHGSVYTALIAGVQMANRSTALNELEYSELVMRLRQVADELDAEPDVPDMTAVMAAARALHQFVVEFDAQLSVNVLSNGAPWAINTLLGALERQGFDVRPDGRLVMPDGDGGSLFSLSTNVTLAEETTSRLTLLLDVPRVVALRDGFGAMVACAKSLSARLDGTIVDDSNHPLSDGELAAIAGQVNTFYSDMEAADISAGSTRALRLFS